MIEIGKNFLVGLASAKQNSRAQQEKYRALADQTDELAQQLRQNYEAQTAYLFRTTAEKMRQAQASALAALAQRQAQRAAHGAGHSASAQQDASTTSLAGQLAAAAQQQELQRSGAEAENTFKRKWQALLQAAADYRRRARKTGRLGSVGRALSSLFK